MFNQTTMIQTTLAHDGYGRHDASQVRRQAARHFWQFYARGLWHKTLAALTGRRQQLEALSDTERHLSITARRFAGNQTVPLAAICGSEGRTTDFDSAFRPLQTHNQDRWINLFTAWQTGTVLPPVELVQIGERYFVRDGHHRLSVAAYLGQRDIDARVTVYAAH